VRERKAADSRLTIAALLGGHPEHDGLIALTALGHKLEVLTRERRAERTYRALGVANARLV
jgi:predicted nucleic acid-binding protein